MLLSGGDKRSAKPLTPLGRIIEPLLRLRNHR